MTSLKPMAAAALAGLALTGCIHVSDHASSDIDEISANTEQALRVCGGEGRVKEVTEDGFTCQDDQ